ncbi:MAG TPA: hypothetical protein PKC24_16210, partial [Cyclobacteriaceae bacterium]|nr:hypothetical protein [Cyclobacteriaceae bacterium]
EAGECILGRPCAIGYFLNGSTQFVEINDNITTGTAQVTLNTAGNYDFIANYGGQSIDRINIIVRVNNPPDFQLLACSNNDVRLQVTENIYDQYVINFGDGSAERIINNNAINVQHDYTAQGTYPVSVRGRDLNAKDNCNAEVKNFTTFESLPLIPINNLSIVNNNTINLSFNTSSGVQNRLQVAVNSNVNFQTVQNIIGDGQSRTIPITNINTEDNLYCFRLGSFDPCTNTTSFGPVICSVQLNLQIQNDNNRLSWNTITAGINNYSIRRNAGPYLSGINATSFDDGSDNITCNTPYCYQVIANYATGTSTSIERCGVSFKTFTPPAINNLSVSVETSGVEINWLAPDNLNIPAFDLGRSINNSNFQVIQSSPFTNFFETQNVIENRVCYRVSYAEECGNSSAAGIEACAITLQGVMSADNVATLNWSTYNGWTDGVLQYRLERLN